MSRGILINDLETYIGWALYDEFVGTKPEEPTDFSVYGTYLNKDSSEKPAGIKKMMKVKFKIILRDPNQDYLAATCAKNLMF